MKRPGDSTPVGIPDSESGLMCGKNGRLNFSKSNGKAVRNASVFSFSAGKLESVRTDAGFRAGHRKEYRRCFGCQIELAKFRATGAVRMTITRLCPRRIEDSDLRALALIL